LPRSQIATIEERVTIEDEYAQRYQKLDTGDPEALDALASWARAHNLEPRARFLEDHARGVRLEQRFASAKTARDLLDVAAWAPAQGVSPAVRRCVANRALDLEPDSSAARHELALVRDDELAAERAADAERSRELAEREKAVSEREKTLSLREQALRERGA